MWGRYLSKIVLVISSTIFLTSGLKPSPQPTFFGCTPRKYTVALVSSSMTLAIIFKGKAWVLKVVSGMCSLGIIRVAPASPPKSAASIITTFFGFFETASSIIFSGLLPALIIGHWILEIRHFLKMWGPSPSSERKSLPTVIINSAVWSKFLRSAVNKLHVQEVSRAGEAWVVGSN